MYVSACEACWRIFNFDIHYRNPAVMRLSFHLAGENSVTLRDSQQLSDVISKEGVERTMFTEWMIMSSMIEIDKILVRVRSNLSDFDGMPLPNNESFEAMENRLIVEELSYNVDKLKKEHERCHPLLNE